VKEEQARTIAEQYLATQPFPDRDYRRILKPGHKLSQAWYFDYAFEHAHGAPESEWDEFAGAPGFIVLEDGSPPRDVSWAEYSELRLDQR
jgi:hypothetical protein